MSAKNRADLITKLHRAAKKQFPVIAPPSNRSVLEHMLYGCCLENSEVDAADEAFAMLQENFCDWNEVRVTTIEELAEVGKGLNNSRDAAASLKRTLFGVFEKYFTYDIDFLKKENLGKAVLAFEKFKGVSPFVVSYVAQNGLGGHSIPLDRAMMSLFYVLGIVSEEEAASGRVPGLERTITKAKGVEFFVVVHQMAVAFSASPFNTAMREVILKINAEAKERLPKRASRSTKAAAKSADSSSKAAASPKTPTKKKTVASASPAAKKATKKVAKKVTKSAAKKSASKTPAKKVTKKKTTNKRLTKKKPR